MNSSIFKAGSKIGLSIASVAGVTWWFLPLSFTRQEDINRGNILNQQLNSYYQQYHSLANTGNWPQLKQVGFTGEELEKAYPEYHKLSNTVYELTFVQGLDGPYLMWNSQERRWKKGFPVIPAR